MNKSESIQELAKALANAQASMPAAKMNAVNPYFKSHYADLGSIIEAARDTLKENDLSYSQLTIGGGDQVGVTTILMHASGEWLESTILIPLGEVKGKSLAQEAGSIITYLRRYSLASVLGIYADEDNDGNPTERAQSNPKKSQPKKEQPAKKNNGNHKGDFNAFWARVGEIGLDKNTARQIVEEKGGDFDAALEALPNPPA